MIERIVYLSIVISASIALGFLWGYRWKQKKARKMLEEAERLAPENLVRQIKVLETFKQAVKVLCPKIQDGEDIEIKVDYLPQKLHSIKLPTKEEDEDTKTAEVEIVRQGNARDF